VCIYVHCLTDNQDNEENIHKSLSEMYFHRFHQVDVKIYKDIYNGASDSINSIETKLMPAIQRPFFSHRKFDWKKLDRVCPETSSQFLSFRKKSTNRSCPTYFVRKMLYKINFTVYAGVTFSRTIEPFVPAITDSNIGSHGSAPIA
jgi:hypothetical protein